MKNFIRNLAVVVLITAGCSLLKFLSTVFDHTWNYSWFQPTLIIFLFALYGFLYKNKDKKLYYTDDETEINCPNCGRVCNESLGIIFSDEDKSKIDGVCMCPQCIANPKSLNDENIHNNLKRQNWKDYDIALIKNAIHRFQNGDDSVLFQC